MIGVNPTIVLIDEIAEIEALKQENAKLKQAARDRVKTFAAERKALKAQIAAFNLIAHLHAQKAFSLKTFGPGDRTAGVLDHIRKELGEIEREPDDLKEWVDVMLLSFDGAMRRGYSPEAIATTIAAVFARNQTRVWPDWRMVPIDKAIEHDRSADREVKVNV